MSTIRLFRDISDFADPYRVQTRLADRVQTTLGKITGELSNWQETPKKALLYAYGSFLEQIEIATRMMGDVSLYEMRIAVRDYGPLTNEVAQIGYRQPKLIDILLDVHDALEQNRNDRKFYCNKWQQVREQSQILLKRTLRRFGKAGSKQPL